MAQETTLDEVMARLNAQAAGTEEYLEKKQELLGRQIGQLIGLVLPSAKKHMIEQALAEHPNGALNPDKHEIWTSAESLSQLLLSNWFCMLEKAKSEANGAMMELSAWGLPKQVKTEELWEGIERYDLPLQDIQAAFKEFLAREASLGPWVEIAPELYLVERGEALWLAGSEKDARKLAFRGSGPKG